MAERRSYSEEEKALALLALEANGGNVLRTSEELGIPNPTLDQWSKGRGVNSEVAALKNEKREGLAVRLESACDRILEHMMSQLPTATFRDSGTVYGILYDKARLTRGEPTEITSDATLSDEERSAALADILKAAQERKRDTST